MSRRTVRQALCALCALALAAAIFAARSTQAQSAHPDAPAAPIVNSTPLDFRLPGTQVGGLTQGLIAPDNCAACHVTEIADNFFGSMMGNAARDPLFRAALQVANADAAGSGELCIRCHAPSAWLNGRATPPNGSAIKDEDLQGVSCSVCHRLVAPFGMDGEAARDFNERLVIKNSQGNLMLGNAAYVIDRQDVRRGPFTIDPNTVSHEISASSLLRSDRICEQCHDIDNPLLSWDDNAQDFRLNPLNEPISLSDPDAFPLFPVERTYSEWAGSAFNPDSDGNGLPDTGGVQALSSLYPGIKRKTMTTNGPVTVCQDCHMPLQVGEIAGGGPTRTVGLHQWAGGSARWQRGIAKFWSQVPGDTLFDDTVRDLTLDATDHGESMLEKAATLQLSRQNNTLSVRITNNTGHKLPTGYAEGRQMWLHVRAFGPGSTLLAEWGKSTAGGGIQNPMRIYEIKLGLSEGYAQAIGRPDLAGEGFHFILNNKVFKDNRIPPRGWKPTWYSSRNMSPVGASYPAGQYWDTVQYTLPAGTTGVLVDLLFLSASGEYLDFLEQEANVAVPDAVVGQPVNWGQVVGDLRDSLDLDVPVVMTSASLNIPHGIGATFLPMIEK